MFATHHWAIEEKEYRRHEQRRGRRHAFTAIRPRRTALVVIDMIPFFVAENPYALGVVDNISRLADGLREAGGLVAWVVPDPEPRSANRDLFFGTEVADRYRTSGGVGPVADRLWPAFDPPTSDLFVAKTAPSAFFPGRCDLHRRLIEADVDTLLITGTVANVCCESSVRDASTLGYRVVMVADGNAAPTDDLLNATLTTIYRSFGDVRTTSDVLALITPTA